MLDRELAEFHGVACRVVNHAVSRNGDRFPRDLMFRLQRRVELGRDQVSASCLHRARDLDVGGKLAAVAGVTAGSSGPAHPRPCPLCTTLRVLSLAALSDGSCSGSGARRVPLVAWVWPDIGRRVLEVHVPASPVSLSVPAFADSFHIVQEILEVVLSRHLLGTSMIDHLPQRDSSLLRSSRECELPIGISRT